MSKDDNILLGRISKLEICFQHASSLLQRTKREWYLADNLTDVLTWLKASENLGYEVEKKRKEKLKERLDCPSRICLKESETLYVFRTLNGQPGQCNEHGPY